MFRPIRILLLAIVSIMLSVAIYWVDSDPPSDTILQMVINVVIVFGVTTILYVAIYGLLRRMGSRKE